MDVKVLIPLAKNKSRCISCVYLCWHGGNTLYEADELTEKTRSEIMEKTWIDANYQHLRCYKELMTPKEMEVNVHSAICPSKGWKPHIDGKTPQMSFQQGQHRKILNWAISGVVISIIILASTLVLGILNLVSC